MKIFNKLSTLVLSAALCIAGLGVTTSCSDDNGIDTNQFVGGVNLNVFGPSPVARGGELRFIGSGLDKITSVEIPGCDPITDIKVISANEIRVTVPQSAQPGKVTLVYAGGQIVTKTGLTFTEPISIDKFAPAKVKAGDELTITGEYLNLIREVIFMEDVVVEQRHFVSQSRTEIRLIVPAEAQTGKFIISDGAPEIPNWIYSDEELQVVLPSVAAPLDLTNAKGGDVITITGEDLDLVVAVLMPDETPVEFEYTEDGKILFTLPDDATDGPIVVLPASGVKVVVANIGMVLPTELVAEPATDIRGGDNVTIKGLNMDQVVSVSFPNVAESVVPASVSASEVVVTFPDMAQSGPAVLNLKSGKTVEIELTTAKPEAIGFVPAEVAAAATFKIMGKNVDLITKVTFKDNIVVDVTPSSATEVELIAPPTAKSGELVLTMANGETVTTDPLTILTPECAFISETVTPLDELKGGELMIVKVENGDRLTGVLVNGESVQYIINNGSLYIALPQTAGKGTTVTLVSSNGQISYTYDVTPATHVENVIWSGAFDCEGWGGMMDLAYGGFDWSTVPAGAKLTVYLTPTVAAGEWWCISFRHGESWGNLPGNVGAQIDMPNDGFVEIVLTQEILDDLIANMGLVLTGTGYIVTQITLSWEISLETDVLLADLPITLSAWENHECGPGLAFVDAGVAEGQVMRIYTTITGGDPAIQIFNGHWGGLSFPECGGTQFNSSTWGDMSCIEIKIGADLYHDFSTYTDWGYCIIFQGQDCVITRITLQ